VLDPPPGFVAYAVVVAPKLAASRYRAILKTFVPPAVKLCTAFKISTLNELQIADAIAIIFFS
jgi:hypothetical protein